jgi:sulfane dehydrogenase subunit SoxC
MNTISLDTKKVVALWSLAQAALIPQKEFFDILQDAGASGLLARCIAKGTLISTKPANAEMNFAGMASMRHYTTSNYLFFTHAHSPPPSVDISKWRLSVEGDGVKNPFSISYDELLMLPSATYTRFLESAGNGRIFFDLLLGKKAAGYQWHFGGFGIAEWTGVQLSEILKIAGILKDAVEVRQVGIDNFSGSLSIPISKAMEDDTLLAYMMNGSILPVDHGFPLRAVVPGWVGTASTKWVNKLIVSKRVSKGSDQGAGVKTQVMKSACCLPWPAKLRAGHQRISGYAWSPFGRISRVDVSLDGGKTFLPVSLTGPNIERAGTRWEFCLDVEPGDLKITPRATDEAGNTQYDISQQKWNEDRKSVV